MNCCLLVIVSLLTVANAAAEDLVVPAFLHAQGQSVQIVDTWKQPRDVHRTMRSIPPVRLGPDLIIVPAGRDLVFCNRVDKKPIKKVTVPRGTNYGTSNNKLAAFASVDAKVVIVVDPEGKTTGAVACPDAPIAIRFSPDGKTLGIVCKSGTAGIGDPSSGKFEPFAEGMLAIYPLAPQRWLCVSEKDAVVMTETGENLTAAYPPQIRECRELVALPGARHAALVGDRHSLACTALFANNLQTFERYLPGSPLCIGEDAKSLWTHMRNFNGNNYSYFYMLVSLTNGTVQRTYFRNKNAGESGLANGAHFDPETRELVIRDDLRLLIPADEEPTP